MKVKASNSLTLKSFATIDDQLSTTPTPTTTLSCVIHEFIIRIILLLGVTATVLFFVRI